MKIRSLLLLPLLFSATSLAGCNGVKEKINIQYGQTISNDVEYITYDELSSMFNGKKTFMVTVYAKTCSCWSMFHAVLNQYISENHIRVFAVDYDSFHAKDGKSLDNFGLNIESGYTSFAIIEKGQIRENLKSGKEKLFKNSDSFKQYIEEKIILPKAFYVSLDNVRSLFESEETSLLYFARSNCGDCSYLDSHVLDEYKLTNRLYILDCEKLGIRQYDEEGKLTPESQALWNQFKIDYYLASNNNSDYGFDTGYVPTLFLLKGNPSTKTPTILSGSVYFNDTLTIDGEKLVVSDTYYTNERLPKLEYLHAYNGINVLKGLEVPKENAVSYGGNYYWDQDAASAYHTPLVKLFLEYSLPKVTHKTFNTNVD